MLYRCIVFCFCFLIFSKASNAELIQWDAFEEGDTLAVKDQSTGLVWLDLDVTANIHYEAAGSLFDGWAYAGYEQVESLLDSVFPDIVFSGELGEENLFEQRCANSTDCYSSALSWQELFGTTQGLRFYQTHSYGLYEDSTGVLRMGGSYVNGAGSANRYGSDFNVNYSVNYDEKFDDGSFYYFSTFLIKQDSISVTLPEFSVGEPASNYILTLLIGGFLLTRSSKVFKQRI